MNKGGACGCGHCEVCRGVRRSTPRRVSNAPHRTEIHVRAARYGDARASMIAGLSLVASGESGRALASLRTRDSDDPAIAIIDASAVAIDVLDFYTERLTAESLLAVAREDASVDLLGRSVGYRASTGVAAEAVLAFEVELIVRGGDVPASVIPVGTRVASKPGPGETSVTFETDEELSARPEWNRLAVVDRRPATLTSTATGATFVGSGLRISIGDGLLFEAQSAGGAASTGVVLVTGVVVDAVRQVTTLTWSGSQRMRSGAPATLVDRVSLLGPVVPSFGVGAPPAKKMEAWPDAPRTNASDVAVDSGRLAVDVGGRIVVLVPGQHVVTTVTSRTDGGFVASNFAGARTVLTTAGIALERTDRSTSVRLIGEKLRLAPELITAAIPKNSTTVTVWGDVTGLPLPRRVVIEEAQGDLNSAPLAIEATVIAVTKTAPVERDAAPPSVQTMLTLRAAIGTMLTPVAATVSANAVHASHGESKVVALGSGDASIAGQSFELRVAPIVFLRTPDGVVSTLVVRVNGVLWAERESFYGATPRDRIYVVEIAIDGKTIVAFGDGNRGARVVDGSNNVVASLRVGADPEVGAYSSGNVRAGRLSDLVDRPLGATKVRNPSAARGGVDPSMAAERRVRIPIGLRAFRRAVTPADYVDLALEQAEVAKARVDVLGGPGDRRIVVTVAGVGDTAGEIGPLAATDKLASHLRASGDPTTRVTVVDHSPLLFDVRGTVFIAPTRAPADVLDAVRAALRREFQAANRRLGSSVVASEVLTIVQAVPGVRNVDLDEPVVDSLVIAPNINALEGSSAVLAADGSIIGASLVALRPDEPDGSAGGTLGITAIVATDLDPMGAPTP